MTIVLPYYINTYNYVATCIHILLLTYLSLFHAPVEHRPRTIIFHFSLFFDNWWIVFQLCPFLSILLGCTLNCLYIDNFFSKYQKLLIIWTLNY